MGGQSQRVIHSTLEMIKFFKWGNRLMVARDKGQERHKKAKGMPTQGE